jgi:hypothetical protein
MVLTTDMIAQDQIAHLTRTKTSTRIKIPCPRKAQTREAMILRKGLEGGISIGVI